MNLFFLLLLLVAPLFGGVSTDGTDDDVQITATTEYGNSDMTIAFWVKRSGYTQYARVVYQDDSFLIGDDTDINVAMYDGGGDRQGYASPDLQAGWQHICVTFDASADDFDIWYNGSEQSVTGSSGWGITGKTDNVIFIGSRDDGNFFEGTYSEFAIWTSILTDAEIPMLYNAKVKGLPLQIQPSNLEMYLPLDDLPSGTSADGDTFVDRTGNGFDGTGDDGANDSGLTVVGEDLLSYP